MSFVEKIKEIIEPVIRKENAELIDLELHGKPGGYRFSVFADTDHGISVEQCTKISRKLVRLPELDKQLGEKYRLEVSSPGINRRIRKKEDFERFVGSKIRIRTRSPIDGRRKVTGVIEGIEENDVIIRGERSGAEGISRIPLAAIDRANLQVI